MTQRIGSRFDVVLDLGAAARAGGRAPSTGSCCTSSATSSTARSCRMRLRGQLVAQVPQGYGCTDGVTGACAAPVELFAESFAKWATGDIGVNLYIGYKVLPPGDAGSLGRPAGPPGRLIAGLGRRRRRGPAAQRLRLTERPPSRLVAARAAHGLRGGQDPARAALGQLGEP